MRTKRPKSVYIQVRSGPRNSKSFTVYDTTLERVVAQVKRALSSAPPRPTDVQTSETTTATSAA